MDFYLGTILMVGFNFAPLGWALCNGQLLSIAQNSALFSLLGTYYGGDGISTFALPNLQGRVPISMGQGAGLSSYQIGESGGAETIPLNVNNLPMHTHGVAVPCSTSNASVTSPAAGVPAIVNEGSGRPPAIYPGYAGAATTGQTMAPFLTAPTGNSLPLPILQPFLAVNFIIALQGTYPSRS